MGHPGPMIFTSMLRTIKVVAGQMNILDLEMPKDHMLEQPCMSKVVLQQMRHLRPRMVIPTGGIPETTMDIQGSSKTDGLRNGDTCKPYISYNLRWPW